MLAGGKNRNRINDQSEKGCLGKIEKRCDRLTLRFQAEMVLAKEIPPINAAINANQGSNIKAPASKNTHNLFAMHRLTIFTSKCNVS